MGDRRFWLLKTEPGEWSWQDQATNGGVSRWDGVKNRQAQNNMKAMKTGDLCFFYHSGTKSRQIVGVVRVIREWYESGGEKSPGNDGAVDVEAVGEMGRPVDLQEMKEEEGLKGFVLFKQPRLSVVPVPSDAWVRICELGGFQEPDMDPVQRRRRRMLIAFACAFASYVYAWYHTKYLVRGPRCNNRDRGLTETRRIIDFFDRICHEQVRMDRRIFFRLRDILQEKGLLDHSTGVSLEEQLVMFLHTIGHNVKRRVVAHQFGHSTATVSRHFHRVLKAIVALYPVLVTLPLSETPEQIMNDPRFYPYFKDCIGAIDGTHVPAHVPTSKHRLWRDRKGNVSENVLAACSFDMKFTYVVSGWEGTAGDGQMLKNALRRETKLIVPQGKYYLVDTGFSNTKGFLNPYRGMRYHLKEYRGSGNEPKNPGELYCLRHSSLRNVIELAFGVVKSRFKILKSLLEYSMHTQALIVLACCLLHNLMLIEKADGEDDEVDRDAELVDDEDEGSDDGGEAEADDVEIDCPVSATQRAEDLAWGIFRDDLANAMWTDYVNQA